MRDRSIQTNGQYFGFRGVAFGGMRGTGKTEAAKYVCDRYGCARVSFADPLKELCALHTDWLVKDVKNSVFAWAWRNLGIVGYTPQECRDFADLVEKEFREHEANGRELGKRVSLLQRVGTEVGRAFDERLWVKLWQSKVRDNSRYATRPLIVCDDVRFPNELHAAHNAGLITIHLASPDEDREKRCAARGDIIGGKEADHSSELSLTDTSQFHRHIRNDGSVERLRYLVDRAIEDHVLSVLQVRRNTAERKRQREVVA